MSMPITKRQKEVLDFVSSFIKTNGYAPTLKEIKRKLKLSAVSTVYQHIKALDGKGYIKRYPNLARGIEIRKKK